MSEGLSLQKPNGANPAWLALPLVVFALITLTVGLLARQTIRTPYSTPFFDLFFSDTLHMKAWLVTAAVILACSQLLTAARIYEVLRFPSAGLGLGLEPRAGHRHGDGPRDRRGACRPAPQRHAEP